MRLVPFRVQFWRRMNVVLSCVAIGDADFLIDHDAHHVWRIVATILIELGGGCRSVPGVVANLLAAFDASFFDVNKYVGELAVFDDGIVSHQVGIFLAADRVGSSVDLFRRRWRTIERNYAADSAGRAGIFFSPGLSSTTVGVCCWPIGLGSTARTRDR